MNAYSDWREKEVKRVGSKVQNAAEALLDKQSSEKLVERNDEKSGRRHRYRESVARVLDARGETTRVKVYTSPNSQAYKDGWERIFGDKG